MLGPGLRTLAASACIALSLISTAPSAQEAPGAAEITNALSGSLPAYWSVQSVDVRASINDGDEVSPRYRQRFVATVVPDEDLYAPVPGDQTLGPFRVVMTTRTTKEAYKLYGIASSSLALGHWATQLDLENSVEKLGQTASLFSVPIVVSGSTEAERAAATLVATQEMMKTIAEGLARAKANSEALSHLAAQEQAALKAANRQRLDALRAQYEQEYAAIEAAAQRERHTLENTHQERLEKLKKQLNEESLVIDAMVQTAAQSRNRLIEENQQSLDALKAQYEKARAAVTAAAETQRAIAEANAEIAALEELSTVQGTLVQVRQRVLKEQQELVAAQIAGRKKRYEELTQILRSDDSSARKAAWDAVLSSDDTQLKTAALEAIVLSEDISLMTEAIRSSITSGDAVLQSKGLAAWISQSPHIVLSVRAGNKLLTMLFLVQSVKEDLTFSGDFQDIKWYHSSYEAKENNGIGAISGRTLMMSGQFLSGDYILNCVAKLLMDGEGKLTGALNCRDDDFDVELDLS